MAATLTWMEPAARAGAELLLNSLWQGALLGGVACCLLRVLPRSQAAVRCLVLQLAMLAMLFAPLMTFLHRGPSVSGAAASPASALAASAAGTTSPGWVEVAPPRSAGKPARASLGAQAPWGTVFLFGVWLVAACCLGVRLARSYWRLAGLKLRSEAPPWEYRRKLRKWTEDSSGGRSVALRSSNEIALPVAAGLTSPAVLFPRTLLDRLDEHDARGIWLHELAHLRRWDDWTKLFQKLAEALLFFHPAARILADRLSLEREVACDQWAVARTGSARPYAGSLARLAEIAYLDRHPAPALGALADRNQLSRRIEMLLSKTPNSRPGIARVSLAAGVLLLAAATVLVARIGPVVTVEAAPAAASATVDLAQPPAPPAPAAAPAPPAPPANPAPQAAPAPPAPPAPQVAPAPAAPPPPSEADSAQVREIKEKIRALVKEMQPSQAEIQKLAQAMQKDVQENVRAHQAEMQKRAAEFRKQIQGEIQPKVKEIQEFARQLSAAQKAGNEQLQRELESKIDAVEKTMRPSEERIRAFEKEMEALAEKIKPSEEKIRALEQQMRMFEDRMRGKEQELRKLEEELRKLHRPSPAAAPAPQPQAMVPPQPGESGPQSAVSGAVQGGVPGGIGGGVRGGVPGGIAAAPVSVAAPAAPGR